MPFLSSRQRALQTLSYLNLNVLAFVRSSPQDRYLPVANIARIMKVTKRGTLETGNAVMLARALLFVLVFLI